VKWEFAPNAGELPTTAKKKKRLFNMSGRINALMGEGVTSLLATPFIYEIY
jgi:hypothetical protein